MKVLGWKIAVQYSQPSWLYICTVAHLVYNVPNLLKYIRSRLYLIIATTEVIVVPSDQLQTRLLSQCQLVLYLFVEKKMFVKSSQVQMFCQSSESSQWRSNSVVLSKSNVIVGSVINKVRFYSVIGDFAKTFFMFLLIYQESRLLRCVLTRGSSRPDDHGHDLREADFISSMKRIKIRSRAAVTGDVMAADVPPPPADEALGARLQVRLQDVDRGHG